MRGALVTGAAKRLGRALAEALAADGWFVCVHYHASARDAEATVEAIRAAGGRAAALAADLADVAAVEGLIARAAAVVGELGLLVNNASLFEYDDAKTLSAARFDRHMATNLRAPALLARDFARQLPAGAEGLIVNLLDQKLWNLNPDFLSYTLSKAGLKCLTEALAMALAPSVRVCGIAPGLVLPSGKMSEARFHQLHGLTPLRRGTSVAEIVAALRFIVATPSYTGQTIVVDGGESLVARPRDVQLDPNARRR